MRYFIAIFFVIVSLSATAQERELSMRAGYSVPFAPYGVWSEKVTTLYANNDFTFYPGDGYGLTFDTELGSGKPFMKYRVGAFYHYASAYDLFEDDQQISEAWLYLTGAGVYAGVTFRAGWEYFGIFNSYNAGFFSFDYRMEMQYKSKLGVIPLSMIAGEAVSGPGGKFELGFYGEYKGLGIYPSFQLLFTHNRQSQAILIKTVSISAGYSF